ncbi:hypothetical protein ACWEKM_09640 [Streptomyces sp. NPDC004752]
MSEESVPRPAGSGQPNGLLELMEELMVALNADLSVLNADLSALDEDLQSAGGLCRAPADEADLA